MLMMSPIPIIQKSMNLNDEFGGSDCGENEARRAFALIKEPTGKDYPSFNHISHDISNIVSNSTKNTSNYQTSDAKRAFEQLRQAFTKAPILQHFDLE